jgi:nitrite reductase/ring-hydroxylating ferredoxin subunit
MVQAVIEGPDIPLSELVANAVVKRKVSVAGQEGLAEVFVMRLPTGELRAYHNVCPHLGAALDAGSGKFMDKSGEALVCRFHQALFKPDTGACFSGPCLGLALMPIGLRIQGNVVQIG